MGLLDHGLLGKKLFGQPQKTNSYEAGLAKAAGNASAGRTCIKCTYYSKSNSYCSLRKEGRPANYTCVNWRA